MTLINELSDTDLLALHEYTKQNLRIESRKKINRLKPYYLMPVTFFALAFIANEYLDIEDAVITLLVIFGFMISFLCIKFTFENNHFEIEENARLIGIYNELVRRRLV